jgi:hypothetical protein
VFQVDAGKANPPVKPTVQSSARQPLLDRPTQNKSHQRAAPKLPGASQPFPPSGAGTRPTFPPVSGEPPSLGPPQSHHQAVSGLTAAPGSLKRPLQVDATGSSLPRVLEHLPCASQCNPALANCWHICNRSSVLLSAWVPGSSGWGDHSTTITALLLVKDAVMKLVVTYVGTR